MPLDWTDNKSTLVQVMARAVKQQAIIWANVDSVLCHHMALLGNDELALGRFEWNLRQVILKLILTSHGCHYMNITDDDW